MPAIRVGVREFREQITRYLASDSPVAVTRHGETLGVFVPTPRKPLQTADREALKAAASHLADALAGVDEDEISADFKNWKRSRKAAGRNARP